MCRTTTNHDSIGDTPYPMPIGDAYADMQPWAGDTSQKGDFNRDNQSPPQTPQSRSGSQPAAHKTPQPTSAATTASPPSMRS